MDLQCAGRWRWQLDYRVEQCPAAAAHSFRRIGLGRLGRRMVGGLAEQLAECSPAAASSSSCSPEGCGLWLAVGGLDERPDAASSPAAVGSPEACGL